MPKTKKQQRRPKVGSSGCSAVVRRYDFGEVDKALAEIRALPTDEQVEESRFQQWLSDWRNVFANEIQAREMFKTAQPQNDKDEGRRTLDLANTNSNL